MKATKVAPDIIEVARQFGSAQSKRWDKERRPKRSRESKDRHSGWYACDRCWRTSDHEFIYELDGYSKDAKHYCTGHLPDEWARKYMLGWHSNRREYAWYRVYRMRLWRDAHPKVAL